MLPNRKKRIDIATNRINKLIQTVADSRIEFTVDEYKSLYLRNKYPDNQIELCVEDLGLDLGRKPAFIAWPTFLGVGFDNMISFCTMSFGALTLNERSIDNDDSSLLLSNVSDYINAAINTIVVSSFCDVVDGITYRHWPTHIDVSDKLETGTLNQTTLSLSSLLRLEFLEPNSNITGVNISEKQLKNRFKFVIECINWLLKIQNIGAQFGGGWAHSEICQEAVNNKTISVAILPSHFCYETITKYLRYFTSSVGTTAIVNSIDDTILKRMEIACAAFEKWVINDQLGDGGYRRNNNYDNSSFPHSCCALLLYAYTDKKSKKYTKALNKLVSYLYSHYNHFNFSLDDVIDAFKYKYFAGDNSGFTNDAFEMVPEAIFLNNCIKAIDNGVLDCLSRRNSRRLREISYVALESLLKRIRTIEISNKGQYLAVEGRQSEQQGHRYPIYCLYYVKTCLEKVRNNDISDHQSRKKYIVTPNYINIKYLLLTILLLGLVCGSYFISATDTLTSLLLGASAIIFPNIIKYFIGHNEFKIDK